MEFTTNYKKHPRKQETFNNKMQKVYKVDFDKRTGVRKLKVDKEINVYDKIQEYKDELNISNILKKYDLDMIKQLKSEEEKLIDLTNLPENLMQTMDVIDQARYAFDRQSKEIKAKFNNDFKQFIAASENGQLAELLNKELKTSAEKFKTANMANVTSQPTLKTYNAPTEGIIEQQPNQVTNQVTGGNVNV